MNSVTEQEHAKMVRRLAKDGMAILDSLTANKCHLMHMAMGIAGEAGEIIDAIKKHVMYEKPIDILNIVEELGDIEFYLEGLRHSLLLTREIVLKANIDKLAGKRYPDGYSDAAATARADKQ